MNRDSSASRLLREVPDRDIRSLLASVQAKGVRLWLEEEQLRYRAPANALSQEEFQQLRRSKTEIIQELRQVAAGQTNAGIVAVMEAPLSYSQLQHWNFYDLAKHAAVRHLAAVRRIAGPLDAQMLERSVREIIQRQDSLRTRFVERDGAPVQVISASSEWALTIRDLTSVPSGKIKAHVQRSIERLIREPVDVSSGPLFDLELLRVSSEEHLLVLVMEHIISDMWSLGLFVRDIFDGYEQLIAFQSVTLPKPAVQFAEYATWQRRHEQAWLQQHGAYWEERLRGFGRDQFPQQPNAHPGAMGWDLVPIDLGPDLSRSLLEWCRSQRTTIVMGVFALYAALVQRWLDREETIIRFESNGRVSPSLEQTIGYFTVPLFLRCRLRAEDTFEIYMQRLINEYCTALERSDSSYVEAQVPRPEYSRNTSFNWIPHTPDSAVRDDLPLPTVSVLEYPFENPFLRTLERDTEPFVLFGQEAMHTMSLAADNSHHGEVWSGKPPEGACERVVGALYFPRNAFTRAEMERLARSFLAMAEAVCREHEVRVFDVVKPEERDPSGRSRGRRA